jgi:hypothetical protein
VDAESLPLGVTAPGHEHDDDAIYLPSGASCHIVVKQQRTTLSAAPLPVLAPGSRAIASQIGVFAGVMSHPPDGVACGKLYLSLRTLRI